VSEVLRVSRAVMEAPPSIVGAIESDYIEGVIKLEDRLLILLDLHKLLNGGEARELQELAA
jgi:purine-binding chemotaxis protein CheW